MGRGGKGKGKGKEGTPKVWLTPPHVRNPEKYPAPNHSPLHLVLFNLAPDASP